MSDCQKIREQLKAFQDDLLNEEDYLAFVGHLEQCRACGEYTDGIDTLQNQVHALGSLAKAPADFYGTVLFKMKQPAAPVKGTLELKPAHLRLFAGFAVIIAFAGLAAYLSAKVPARNTAAPRIAPEEITPAAEVIPAESVQVNLPALHWHVEVADEAGEKKLADTITALGAEFDYRSPETIVFSADGKDLKRLYQGLKTMFPARDFTAGDTAADAGVRRVSIFLLKNKVTVEEPVSFDGNTTFVSREQSAGAGNLHWHILLVAPKKEELFGLFAEFAAVKEYGSAEAVVFSVPANGLGKLAEKVVALEGVFADIDPQGWGPMPVEGKVRVSLYFPEK